MNVLVVEDDDFKLSALLEAVRATGISVNFTIARSFSAAAKCVKVACFDLLLLDMSLPTYDSGDEDVQGFGGRRVLRVAEEYGNSSPTILVTQYATYEEVGERSMTVSEIAAELAFELGPFFLGAVAFDRARTEWALEIQDYVRTVRVL